MSSDVAFKTNNLEVVFIQRISVTVMQITLSS